MKWLIVAVGALLVAPAGFAVGGPLGAALALVTLAALCGVVRLVVAVVASSSGTGCKQ